MKKLFVAILSVAMAVLTAVGLTACQEGAGAKGTSMTNWGNTLSVGGMIAETENYIYYINGVGNSSEDNTFGKPVKGALMVAEKASLGGELKTEIVVPKLFVASDYNAGIYIANNHVYYGTPSTSKDSSGNVASGYLTFMRTSLDGKATETFFTIKGLDTNYRFAEKDGVVYIVYYDAEATALKSYNTVTKTAEEIIKTDAKTRTEVTLEGGSKVYLSLDSYKFVNGADFSVVFTVKAYAEDYYEEKEENTDSYTRATEPFNLVYTYSAGEVKDANGVNGKVLFNGEANETTYAITLIEDGFMFYTATDVTSKVKTYGLQLSAPTAFTLIKNAENLKAGVVINSLQETYYVDTTNTENSVVYKINLTDAKTRETILGKNQASSLLFTHGDYLYYHNTSNKIARVNLNTKAEEIVSNDTVTTVWYTPEFITVGSSEYLFYCDNSPAGSSYVKYVDVNATAVKVEGETDAEDYYALEGHKQLGVMTVADMANVAITKIKAIPTSDLEYTVAEGTVTLTAVSEARAEYEKLSEEGKKAVSQEVLNKLLNAEKAQILANYYYKLNNYADYNKMTEEQKATFTADYNAAKTYRDSLEKADSTTFISIRDSLKEELKYYYQEAGKLINK